jgi:hypothetical protein
MSDNFNPDRINRTALYFLRSTNNADAGISQYRESRMRIVAGAEACRSREGQAALVTAVMTSARAFADVTAVIHEPTHQVCGGPMRGRILGEVLAEEGVWVQQDLNSEDQAPTLVLGSLPKTIEPQDDWLKARWTDWTATVLPLGSTRPEELGSCDGNVLASITAGALGVAEIFLGTLAQPGSDAGRRTTTVDLWAPRGGTSTPAPQLMYAPAQWWLLGLGHLGQSFAHVLSWLNYRDPNDVQVVLQDIQRTVPANHSTGLLTPAKSEGDRKTRLVASALDRCGYDTVVVERPLDEVSPVRPSDVHVALIGVDNLSTRLLIEDTGWSTAIDVGLGAGAADFDGITIVRFPGRPAAVIKAWRQQKSNATLPRGDMVHVPSLDACGVARLNGVAVGASFVGAIAGTLGISEALRCLHGGVAHSILSARIRDGEIDGGVTGATHPIALELTR